MFMQEVLAEQTFLAATLLGVVGRADVVAFLVEFGKLLNAFATDVVFADPLKQPGVLYLQRVYFDTQIL